MDSHRLFMIAMLATLVGYSTAEIFTRNLCLNDTGTIEYSEPYDVTDTLKTWELGRQNCSAESALVIHIGALQLRTFEPGAYVRLQGHCIDELSIGTCYVFQRNYSELCGNLVNQHQSSCNKFVWIYSDVDLVEIILIRVANHPISIQMNYTVTECTSSIITRPESSILMPVASIILGILLAIVIMLLLVVFIRHYRQDAIQMMAEKKSGSKGFETLVGDYDVSPYEHYQVPNSKPLYEPALDPEDDGLYEIPSIIPANDGKTEDAVIYSKPNKGGKVKGQSAGYGALNP